MGLLAGCSPGHDPNPDSKENPMNLLFPTDPTPVTRPSLLATMTTTRMSDDAGADVFEELDVDLWEEPERWDGLS